jgi:hypothetical protein
MSRRLLLMPSVHRPPVAAVATAPDDGVPDDDLGRYRRPPFQPGPSDAELLAVLAVPPPAPSVALAYAHLEQRVQALLLALPHAERRALARRLAVPHPDDPLIAAWGRLTGERRARLGRALTAPPTLRAA